MNALRYVFRWGPSPKEQYLRKQNKIGSGVSPCAERIIDSNSGACIAFFDRKLSFDAVEPRSVRRNEKHLYSDSLGKSPNATGMAKYHVVQQNEVAGRLGKVFNDSTKLLVLLWGPSVPAKPRPPLESTTARTDNIVVLFESDRTDNGLPSPRILINDPTVLSEGSLIDWNNKPTPLCFMPIMTFQELCFSCDVGKKMALSEQGFFATVCQFFSITWTTGWETEKQVATTILAFAFSQVINRSFSTIKRKCSLRISGFDAERM
jgi:hypothetical protein